MGGGGKSIEGKEVDGDDRDKHEEINGGQRSRSWCSKVGSAITNLDGDGGHEGGEEGELGW